jgi:murein DD-endopeptidase MepM/ murein hydrolase activator NlpD
MKYLFFLVLIYLSGCAFISNNPKYYTPSDEFHYVKRGETLQSVSEKYSISQEKLKIFNGMQSDKIFPGQKIYLSPKPTFKSEFVTVRSVPKSKTHIVKKKESIQRISKMYDVAIIDLMDINNLTSLELQTGQKLRLEFDKNTISQKPVKKAETTESSEPDLTKPKPPTQKAQPTSDFIVPVQGTLTSSFGLRNGRPHKGVDIAASSGSPISAANSGKVVFSGRQRGYGNVVIVEHPGFVMTVYAHNESNLVRLGDNVQKGQPIATVGETGTASGPHLHFEYRQKGKAVDPQTILGKL